MQMVKEYPLCFWLTASNIYREILQEVQQYCPIAAVYAEILQEMQQIQR
ncbi:hypothetical protein MHH28_20935 [Paenibacillus sp. FSL K6-1217]